MLRRLFLFLVFPLFTSLHALVDVSEVAAQATPAVVAILVEADANKSLGQDRYENPYDAQQEFFRRFFGAPRQPRQRAPQIVRGQGSGFFVTADGYILTNNHVIEGADQIKVVMNSGRELPASLVGRDRSTDLAVIKVEGDSFPVLSLADSDRLRVGQPVCAIGNPFGLQATVTAGVLSAMGRHNLNITDYEDFLQTDAAINRGNSGGPLLDLKGEVIGVNTAIAQAQGGGIGFAIPSSMARQIMDQLIDKGGVTRGYVGIQMTSMSSDIAEWYGLDKPRGVIVADVMPGSPAERSGLRPGDIILQVDGDEVRDMIEFRNKVKLAAPGRRLRLQVMREDERQMLDLEVGESPTSATIDHGPGRLMGVEVGAAETDSSNGVVIIRVLENSAAAAAGLLPGDIIFALNQRTVSSPAEFYALLQRAQRGDRLLLHVQRGSLKRTISMTVS